MSKNIKHLTKISINNMFNNITKEKNGKLTINKNSIFLITLIIIGIVAAVLSNYIIEDLKASGNSGSFITILFGITFFILLFQVIVTFMNLFYFSPDIEHFLSIPVKPVEILIAKSLTLLLILYMTEISILLIPLTLYGINMQLNFVFYILMSISFLLLPIFIVSIIGIVNFIIVNSLKIFKNKNKIQYFSIISIIVIILILEILYFTNMEEAINNLNIIFEQIINTTLILEPIIKLLNFEDIGYNLLKVILYSLTPFFILIFIGINKYNKVLLTATNYDLSNSKKVNVYKKIKKKTHLNTLIDIEFKTLFRSILLFMQTFMQTFILGIILIILIIIINNVILPQNSELVNFLNTMELSIDGFGLIVVGVQILFSIYSISIMSTSKFGKSAILIKSLPINEYKLYISKNIPEIINNSIIIFIIVLILKMFIETILWPQIISIALMLILISIFNSSVLAYIDIKNPKLYWNTETELLKQNNNKILQYAISLITILITMYLIDITLKLNLTLNNYININIAIYSILILIFNIIININIRKNKLYNKIY